MNPLAFKAIIFDMDGVLCDSEPLIAEAACRMFAERHHISVQPSDFKPFVGTGEERFLGGVAELYGVTLSLPADKNRTYAFYLDIIKGRLLPLSGVQSFIIQCRKRGMKLAVASSADAVKVDGNLREIQLPRSRFDAVVSGNEVTRKKPFPDLFLLAAQRIGVPARDCLVIEDAVSGIHAAVSGGMRALGLTTSFSADTLTAAGASWVAPDLAHMPDGWT